MINEIEKVQLDAWPALRTYVYDGWLLRSSEGVTRRSNSISPIYSSSIDLDKKIEFCEDHYRKAGLPVIFKLTKDVYPDDLDTELDKRGYVLDAETSVQLLEISDGDHVIDPVIRISDTLHSDWLEHFINDNGYAKSNTEAYGNILRAIRLKTGFADLSIDEKHAGCGLGVLKDEYLGLFDIVIHPGFRRQGFGKKLVESIIAWGKANGAKITYLQVMTENPQALELYEKIGFEEIYKYWYRVKA